MSRLLAGWDSLEPALVRLLRINLLALVVSTVALGTAYALGFRHTSVLVDLAVMLVATALMLVTLPLTPRFGARAVLVGFALSAGSFAVGGTWATPNLSPLTALLMLVPMLVAIPYVSRAWLNAFLVYAVVGQCRRGRARGVRAATTRSTT